MTKIIPLPVILVLGDAVAPTGFARVVYNIFRPLAKCYKIHQIGTNYFGDPHDWPWEIYPARSDGHPRGVNRVAPLVRKLKPDIVFILQDPWVVAEYLQELRHFKDLKVVVYCSINAAPLDPKVIASLQGCNALVVYTEFARQAIQDGLQRISQPITLPPIQVIPHGVDTEAFYPLDPDRKCALQLARQKLYAGHEALQQGFIVLNANRNQPRKRIDIALEGFARFAANKPPNVFLHLHMGMTDLGWDLQQLGRRLGIDSRLIFTSDSPTIPNVSETQLNLIYNATNVGINTSSSEGWGLVAFEHAATGVAQIVPAHTSGLELWKDSALLLRPSLSLVTPQSLVTEHLIDPDTLAASLEELYTAPDKLKALDSFALANASQDCYRWSVIAELWAKIFQKLLA